jgi:HK97 family phage major capsid protein
MKAKTTEELLNGQATAKELREGRARIKEQMRDIVRTAEKEGRSLNQEEKDRFGKFDTDYEGLSEKLNVRARMEQFEAEEAEQRAKEDPTKRMFEKMTPEQRSQEKRKLFWKAILRGENSLSSDERTFAKDYLKRGTSTQITTTEGLGGYIVPQQLQPELEARMLYYGPMLEAARVLRTGNGELITWPTLDDTSTTGQAHDESSPSVPVQDLTFGEKQLLAYTRNTGIVKVSVELQGDSYFDLEQVIFDAFGDRLGRKLNADTTTANGSDKPNGFINAINAANGTVNAGDDTTLARTDILNLIHGVDRAYRVGLKVGLMMHDTILKEIKALAVGTADDRPLWQPSMREGAPDMIEGHKYWVNNDMSSSSASDQRVMAFGDFDKFVIRLVGAPVIVPLRERFMDDLQVGYVGYWRWDSELIQSNAIKALRMTTT